MREVVSHSRFEAGVRCKRVKISSKYLRSVLHELGEQDPFVPRFVVARPLYQRVRLRDASVRVATAGKSENAFDLVLNFFGAFRVDRPINRGRSRWSLARPVILRFDVDSKTHAPTRCVGRPRVSRAARSANARFAKSATRASIRFATSLKSPMSVVAGVSSRPNPFLKSRWNATTSGDKPVILCGVLL